LPNFRFNQTIVSASGTCKECGTAIPGDSPEGFCAQCLLGLGLEKTESSPEDHHSHSPITAPLKEKPGDRIGRYKLLQKIGHGGCGVVYMAEQNEPIHRRVALKVIKLGMDTKQVVARFEAERQALALMDHPNIAKVLDAGATETGRPYFVMELVGGIRITDYCDQHQLTTRQRLDLFIQVCKAIQHAHQKGIIHRDIKPSNVLVAEQDGVATPKVIDFGIAKATQGRLTDQTLFTAFEQFLGTPAYMSPEQTQLGSLDVDTRSDIYGLGVLLYELLTGKTPFDTKELMAAGLDEMRRTIREVEPVKPSTRLTQELQRLGSARASRVESDAPSDSRSSNQPSREESQSNEVSVEATKTARGARALPKSALRTPHSAIDRDLDWIVMKCLEKDRARRYETANGLATDIERHLQSEPVVAGPPSNLYRFQKAIRRNKTAFTLAAAVAVVLVAGVVASTWQALRATRAERASTREAAKSQQLAGLLGEMFKGVGPSVALGQDTTLLRGILDKAAKRLSAQLTNQPQAELEFREVLAKAYFELSLYKEAQETLQGSLKLARATFGNESVEVASALGNLGLVEWGLGEFDKAAASEREALRIQRSLSDTDDLVSAGILNNLGMVLEGQGRFAQAEESYREALAIHRKFSSGQTPEAATLLYNLGNALGGQHKFEAAETTLKNALELRRKLFGNAHPEVAMVLNSLATVMGKQGRLADAEEMLRELVEMQRKFLGNEHRYIALALYNLASCLREEGKLDEAEQRFKEALEMVRKLFGDSHIDVASSLFGLADLLGSVGRFAEAESMFYEALPMFQQALGTNHPQVVATRELLITALQHQGKSVQAEALCQEQITSLRSNPGTDTRKLGDALWQLTSTLFVQGKSSETERAARECLTCYEAIAPDDWPAFNARSLLGAALFDQQKYADAEPYLISGYEGLKRHEASLPVSYKLMLGGTLDKLVQLYDRTGKTNQANEWKQKLMDLDRAQNNP